MITLFSNFPSENCVAISRIRQDQGQDDDHPPEGEAQGFMLRCRFLKGDIGRDDIRINRGDQAKISCEEEDHTKNKRQDLTAGPQIFDDSIKSQQPDQRKNPDEIDPGRVDPI